MATLYELTSEQMRLYNLLNESIDEETGEVNQDLLDALDLNKVQIEEKGKQYAIVYKQVMADIKMYKDEETRLSQKRKTLERNAERLKSSLETALLTFGIDKLEDPKVSVSFRKSKKVVINDENDLRPEFVKVTYTPDKLAIKDAIEKGMEVSGAELVESKNIQIK